MMNICRVFPQYRKPGLKLAKASLHAFATLMGTAEAQDARLPAHAPERKYKTCYIGLLASVRHHLEHCIGQGAVHSKQRKQHRWHEALKQSGPS